jgi:hypothetical protein
MLFLWKLLLDHKFHRIIFENCLIGSYLRTDCVRIYLKTVSLEFTYEFRVLWGLTQNCVTGRYFRTECFLIITISLWEENYKKNIWTAKENHIWRVKTNEELEKLIKHKNRINYIKAQRLSWFGHVQRMLDTRTFKKIFNWKPLTKRLQGRPKYRWEDNIKQDICQMKIQNWIAFIEYRGKRKKFVEEAKTFN